MDNQVKYVLQESELPRQWYNVVPDLPAPPPPPLHPGTREPVGPRAATLYGLDLEVWMVRASYDQKPYRRLLMEAYGATVHPSPSDVTSAGRAVLAEHPDSTGSLGIAISEAVEVAAGDPDTRYALGS